MLLETVVVKERPLVLRLLSLGLGYCPWLSCLFRIVVRVFVPFSNFGSAAIKIGCGGVSPVEEEN